MKYDLSKHRIAILATDGFEEVELTKPLEALREAGATVDIVAPREASEKIRAWDHDHWSGELDVDVNVSEADPERYDGLLLPGGVMNPDHLRMDRDAVEFVRAFFRTHKPVASICHGPWMLVEAEVAEGRRVTSYPSIRKDLENAGATWVDEEVVVDEGLVTSRKPDDLPAFIEKMKEEFHEGKHAGQTV